MPQNRFLKKWSQPLLVSAIVLAAVVMILALVARQYQGLQDTVGHASDVKGRLTLVYSLVQEAEAGVRGFILTSDDFHLASLMEAEQRLTPEMDALTDLLADTPVQANSLARLRANVETRVDQLDRLVAAARAGDTAGIIEDMRQRIGFTLMRDIRTAIDVMIAEEDRRLVDRRASANRTAVILQVLAYGTLFLIMTVAVLGLSAAARRRDHLEAVEANLRAANDRLSAEMMGRERVEEQLRQVQKMEAIGHLSGGIAHDFNNMLAVIMGALNIMQRRIARGDFAVQPLMQAAIEGAERGGALTHRLLAFARKQLLEPRPLDVNKLVSGMSDLLRRTLGETIETEVALAGDVWRIHADAHQLETSILNRVVNARDAMPQGGKLRLETANARLDRQYVDAHPNVALGDYVLISVSDTGTGMPPEVVSRAFDPFFTTKEPGKGTGLGLSQVYGFVTQSGGHIKILSEQGRGTTFRIYLPRYTGSADSDGAKAADQTAARPVQGESILVVEDDEAVRRLAVEGLSELGYAVIAAATAEQALKILEDHPSIALLFTDVVMPNVNGRELAEQAQRLRPRLKVLFTTGYTRDVVVSNGTLEPGVRLIGKPYTLQQLSRAVREALDA